MSNKLRNQNTMTDEERAEYLQINAEELLFELNEQEIEDLALFLDDLDPEVRPDFLFRDRKRCYIKFSNK